MLQENVMRVMDTLRKETPLSCPLPKVIAVTKTVTADEVLPLKDLGISDFAENKVQVFMEKWPKLQEKFSFHMIGRLQTNKVKYIIEDVTLIHSVDRVDLADEINKQAQKRALVKEILLQVNVSKEDQKAGVLPHELQAFYLHCASLKNIRVRGLMTMLPLVAEEDQRIEWFTQTKDLLTQLKCVSNTPHLLTELSMGMSGDYHLATRCGATMVRIGRKLFDDNF